MEQLLLKRTYNQIINAILRKNKDNSRNGEVGNQYYRDSDFVSKMSYEIADMSEEITVTVGQVNEAVQEMALSSQKSSEEAEVIRESINETTKAIEQVAIIAQKQAELAQKLNEIIDKLKYNIYNILKIKGTYKYFNVCL